MLFLAAGNTSLLGAVTAGKLSVFFAVLAVGVVSGILSALLGVGGAVVTTPAIRFLGASPIEAVGSTVPAILPGAISGSLRYAREGLVHWRTSLSLGAAGALFAFAGAVASDFVDGRFLMLLTAVLMLWSGVSVVRGGRTPTGVPAEAPVDAAGNAAGEAMGDAMVGATGPDEVIPASTPASAGTSASASWFSGSPAVPEHSLLLLASLGAVSGFVAGFLGVGGGIVMVPILTGPLRFPMRAATASSLVAVAIFSVPALLTHAWLGHINWFFAVPLMIGVVPGARIGAALTVGASDRTIRLTFGIFIVLIAVIFAATQFVGVSSS